MRKICYNNKDRMMAGMICGGWDPYEGGQVYEIPLGGTLMQQKFAVGGSGSSYIYGLVDSTYKEGMTKEECKTFVKTGKSSPWVITRCAWMLLTVPCRCLLGWSLTGRMCNWSVIAAALGTAFTGVLL